MTLNAAGFVQAFDGGAPRYVIGLAKEVISGGEFVYADGTEDSVSSGLNSFATSDIEFSTDASGAVVTGVAAYNVESGAELAVATRGAIICSAQDTCTEGTCLTVDGSNSLADTSTACFSVGRALTGASSGGYTLVHLNL